jgi:hypothetical protein
VARPYREKSRKFGGKVYRLFDFAFNRSEAEQEAKEVRKDGSLVRVVRAGDGYLLWRRNK